MGKEIVVAVVDTGVDYWKLDAARRDRLYWNDGEKAGNGIDDDRNGRVDDVTGPSTGPARNHYYQATEGSGHGLGMITNVARQIDAAEAAAGRELAVSIMPVSMYSGGYYSNIVAAAEAGASIISLSHNLSYGQRAYVSRLLEPYDAIAVTVGRDTVAQSNPDAGEGNGRAFDNVIEVGLISNAIVRGNGRVDLLEVGSSLNNTTESHAIATTAGKIASIWALDASLSPAELLDLVAASTTMSHPTIAAKRLSSEMGGRIDLDRAVALLRGTAPEKDAPPDPKPHVDLNEMRAVGGYHRGTTGDDLVILGGERTVAFGWGGDDVFQFVARPNREHVIRDFRDGDSLDLRELTDGAGGVRLQEVSWSGSTHTRVQVQDDDGRWFALAILHDVEGATVDALLV